MIRAARQGDKEAQYWLSRLYYNGEGVAKNRGKADCWNKKSCCTNNSTTENKVIFR